MSSKKELESNKEEMERGWCDWSSEIGWERCNSQLNSKEVRNVSKFIVAKDGGWDKEVEFKEWSGLEPAPGFENEKKDVEWVKTMASSKLHISWLIECLCGI